MVHWLAEGLVARGHRVTLIGAGLDGLPAGGYFVADTEVSGERLDRKDADTEHAERAGKILDQLAVDLVADHSRAGYLPGVRRRVLFGVRTVYGALALPRHGAQPGYVGLVAISRHQRLEALSDEQVTPSAWSGVVHPGIPFAEHTLSPDHDGPVVYVGPLVKDRGVELAISAAHEAGLPVAVAGVRSSAEARVHAEVVLRPKLRVGDVLLEETGLGERWDLLRDACCLVAPR